MQPSRQPSRQLTQPRLIIVSVVILLALLFAGAAVWTAAPAQAGDLHNSAAAPTAPLALPVVDDFEAGLPGGWFQYGDYGAGTAIATNVVADATVPGAVAGNHVMEINYTSAGWGGGTGRNLNSEDWSAYEGFAFWFRGLDSGATFRVILSDNMNPALPGDTAERFAFEFVDNSAGWRHVHIPWGAFFRDYAYQPPGAPDDGLTLTEMHAYALALPSGTTGIVLLDDVRLVRYSMVDDFESGLPATWFQYGDYGAGTSIATNVVPTDTIPGAAAGNHALEVVYTVAGWGGGTGRNLGGPDWSAERGFSFWFRGNNSGAMYRVILSDNLNPALPGDTAERFAFEFYDTSTGWRYISIPWGAFFRDYAYQPPGAPDDGLTLTEMQAYAFALPLGSRTAFFDHVALFGDGVVPLTVAFTAANSNAAEGATALISVTLSATSTTDISVDYATSDGTATAGSDYTPSSGTLLFPAGSLEQTISVTTLEDGEHESNETVNLTLSNPVSATLGAQDTSVLTIIDNDPLTSCDAAVIVDDFEDGALPSGLDPNGIGVGFITWNHPAASAAITITSAPPAQVPGAPAGNNVLQESLTIGGGQWAGYTHAFTNAAANQWLTQDWSTYEGVCQWLYGNNTGGTLFLDIMDNRNPGSTSDDAERWSVDIPDNFAGWQLFQFDWGDFHRKDIGNGAPNDGFGRSEIHGYAIGGYGSVPMGSQVYFVDDVSLIVRTTIVDNFEDGALPSGVDPNGIGVGFVTWNHPAASAAITITSAPPAQVPGAPAGNNVLQESLTIGGGQWAGYTHAFTNAAANQWLTQDWSTYEGVCQWLYGNNTGGTLFLDIMDNRNPGSTSDDAERWSVDIPDNFAGWQLFQFDWGDFHRKDIGNGAPNDGFGRSEIHGYAIGGYGSVPMGSQVYFVDDVTIFGNTGGSQSPLQVQFGLTQYQVDEGNAAVVSVTLTTAPTQTVTVAYSTVESYARPDRNFVPTSGAVVFASGETEKTFTVQTLGDGKPSGDQTVMLNLTNVTNAAFGFRRRALLTIEDTDPANPALVDDFEGHHPFQTTGPITLAVTEIAAGSSLALPGQGPYEQVLQAVRADAYGPSTLASLTRTFAGGQDWSGQGGLRFWFYGNNSGRSVKVNLLDNQAPLLPPPAQWVMAWGDEFNGAAGAQPDPNAWGYQIGDGTMDGIPGWGNSEEEFYTNSPDNVALDGSGNLRLRLLALDPNTTDKICWYGPCKYTSGRLLTKNRTEFLYGRIEARILLPAGESGLWPAFWSLGSNIDQVGWPQSGEMDIMEYVSRMPNEIFGTIHGPGYSGGSAFGNAYNFGAPAALAYHTYAIEWAPDEIHWFVDGINYHNAIPANVAPNEWVYNHPFYLLLNMAIGGNFGGAISPNLTFPQDMLIDYVRVYQAPDSAERFETTFVDDSSGWRQVTLPFTSFTRSAVQPPGAPNDGLTLTSVTGYGFEADVAPLGAPNRQVFYLDQVQLVTSPTAVTMAAFNGDSPASPLPWLIGLGLLALSGLTFALARRRLA